ncbi:MAG: type II secretion system F family protein [Acidimicrobiales bacterium]
MSVAVWEYQALDAGGELVSGKVPASSEPDAARQVRQLGLRPARIVEARTRLIEREISIPGLEPRVRPSELGATVRQLSTMLASGVAMRRSLKVLTAQTANPTLKATLVRISDDVESGESLSAAFAKHPRIFGNVLVALVRAGESAGALDRVLDQAADNLERQAALRAKIRSTLAYPAAVIFLVIAVLIAMSVFVVPVFRGVYEDLGQELPSYTRVVLAVTGFIGGNVLAILAAAGVGGVALRRWRRRSSGRRATDRLLLAVPVLGDLVRQAALARAARSLSVLKGAGVPLLEAVDITAATVGNEVLAEVIREAGTAVASGLQLSDPLEASGEIPPLFAQVIAVGEESGDLEEMLAVLARMYDDGVESTSATFSAVIEPLMIAGLGAVVGGLVLALYLPMFRLVDIVQ